MPVLGDLSRLWHPETMSAFELYVFFLAWGLCCYSAISFGLVGLRRVRAWWRRRRVLRLLERVS